MRAEFETGRDRLRRLLDRPPVRAVAPAASRASVAALLAPGEGGPDLWFILRAARDGDPWSGQVALPGGRMDAADPDSLHTAVRETREELGVDLEGAEVLGALDDLAPLTGLPNLVVHPWAFWVPEIGPLTPSPREVAEVFTVPLRDLVAGAGRTRFVLDWKGQSRELACVWVPTPAGPARLWGMTLRIVDDLLHRIDGGGIGLERATLPGGSLAG